MGLDIGTFGNFSNRQIIDTQALTKVTQKILNPENSNSIDVSKLDLSKFNRVDIGTDLYSQRTNTETALRTAKAAIDFDVNLSKAFSANVQYLNSVAAQSLFTSKENTGKVNVQIEQSQNVDTAQALQASSSINETHNLNKDRRGSNPFSFYTDTSKKDSNDTEPSDIGTYTGINFFA